MKNKILIFLGIFIVSLSLTACNKDNSKEVDVVEEISTEDSSLEVMDETIDIELINTEIEPIASEQIDNSTYSFYAAVSIYMEDFNRNYVLIGNAIDDRNINDFNYYFSQLQNNIDSIEKLKEPSSMTKAKKQIINGLKKYKESSIYLKEAYEEVDYSKYNKFRETASAGANSMSNFLKYCDNFKDYISYLSSFMETSFYLSNYTLYSQASEFSDEENLFLYTINHSLILLSDSIDNSFVYYAEGKDYRKGIQEINETIELFDSLSIENENLIKFRDKLVEGLKTFVIYFEEYFEGLENDTLEQSFNKTEEISKNAQKIYDAMSYMQEFYGEHQMSIDFIPTSDYVDVTTSYEIQENEEGNIEVIGETETIN